jgi:hypothetical protein
MISKSAKRFSEKIMPKRKSDGSDSTKLNWTLVHFRGPGERFWPKAA